MLTPEPPASGSVASVAAPSFDALGGRATPLPALGSIVRARVHSTFPCPDPAPISALFPRGTEVALPGCTLTGEVAKTDALVVSLAAPLAIAAPPFADIAPFLVRNVMSDSLT